MLELSPEAAVKSCSKVIVFLEFQKIPRKISAVEFIFAISCFLRNFLKFSEHLWTAAFIHQIMMRGIVI